MWSDKIIHYIRTLGFNGKLPPGIRIMNPYLESEEALKASEAFYQTYYSDNEPRRLIMGINPGRHGAGATGIPFTDPKRLKDELGIPWTGPLSHEPSSVFIYEMINAFGGPAEFYGRYFINSVSPLGFTILNPGGREVNFNYYDLPRLYKAVSPFIRENFSRLRAMGFQMDRVYCLGKRNAQCLEDLNREDSFFGEIIVLEHPRYIMQYRSRQKQDYIRKYVDLLG